jgi:predicted dehydrogenase
MTSLAHEPGPFGQRHEMEFHGSGGTLRTLCDWRTVQRVEGCRADEDTSRELPIPDHAWGGARRSPVHDTYRDVFRTQDTMARRFVRSVAEGVPVAPSFADGLAVQRVLEAADRSARQGRRVEVAEVVADGG